MVIIRNAKAGDLPRCEEMSVIPELEGPEGYHPTATYFHSFLNKGLFLIAEEENQVVGYIAGEVLNSGDVYIDYFVVDPLVRSRGVGSKLLEEFIQQVKNRGSTEIFLFASADHHRTLQFYEKKNFTKGTQYYLFTKKLQ